MSWNVTVPETPQEDFIPAAKNALESASLQDIEECANAVDAAIAAAAELLETGVLGEGPVKGTLSGHARPGNEGDGSSPDSITISLQRVS
jgi:hypothetical protein